MPEYGLASSSATPDPAAAVAVSGAAGPCREAVPAGLKSSSGDDDLADLDSLGGLRAGELAAACGEGRTAGCLVEHLSSPGGEEHVVRHEVPLDCSWCVGAGVALASPSAVGQDSCTAPAWVAVNVTLSTITPGEDAVSWALAQLTVSGPAGWSCGIVTITDK